MNAKQIALVETELFLKTVMKNKKVEKIWKILYGIIQINKLIAIPHRIQKLDEILVLDDDSSRVVIRMEAQARCVLQVLVNKHMHVMLCVVD